MRLLLLSLFVCVLWVCVCDLHGQPCVYVCVYVCALIHLYIGIYIVYRHDLCACDCWEYIFILTTDRIWGCGAAAAASTILRIWIWHDIFSSKIHSYVHTCIIYMYSYFFLFRNVSFGEANGSHRISCPWNEPTMFVFSYVCMLGDVEGLKVRTLVISQVHNLLFVPLCQSLTVITKIVGERSNVHFIFAFS